MPAALVPIILEVEILDIIADPSWLLPYLPFEIVGEIGGYIEGCKDFLNFRWVNRRFRAATQYALSKRIDKMTVYPRLDCMQALLVAVQNDTVANCVHNITLLAEGLREHEYGYAWAWEDLQIWADVDEFRTNDIKIINDINAAHAKEVMINGEFITSGKYRTMLITLLRCFPRLRTITCRKLAVGEQMPGWAGAKLVEKLSFYHEDLDTRQIFYGDWMYDTVHKRETYYRDEFGDVVCEDDCGPQASFMDDLKGALLESGTEAKVVFMPVDR